MSEKKREYIPMEHLYESEFKEFKERYNQILKLEEDKYTDAYTKLVEDIYSFSSLIGEEFNTVMYHLTK
jgi:hypothetical protein